MHSLRAIKDLLMYWHSFTLSYTNQRIQLKSLQGDFLKEVNTKNMSQKQKANFFHKKLQQQK